MANRGRPDITGMLAAWKDGDADSLDSYLPHLRMSRVFRPLDPDPRFQDLLRRQGLLP